MADFHTQIELSETFSASQGNGVLIFTPGTLRFREKCKLLQSRRFATARMCYRSQPPRRKEFRFFSKSQAPGGYGPQECVSIPKPRHASINIFFQNSRVPGVTPLENLLPMLIPGTRPIFVAPQKTFPRIYSGLKCRVAPPPLRASHRPRKPP